MSTEIPSKARAGTIRSFLAGLSDLAHTRMSLMSLELQDQIHNYIKMAIFAMLIFACLTVGLVALLILAYIMTPEIYRACVFGSIALISLLIILVSFYKIRSLSRTNGSFLRLSRDEIKKDLQALKGA